MNKRESYPVADRNGNRGCLYWCALTCSKG